jgi:hypothetical protein
VEEPRPPRCWTAASPPGLHRDATDLPFALEQVSPSSSPDGCCGGLRTTCAPPMSNLVPAALIPMPFALEPEPPGEGRSRPWSSRHRGVGAGPAGDGVVLLYFPCSEPSSPSSSATPPRHSPPCPECEVRNPFTLMWTRPSSRGWTEPCELADCVMTAVPHRAAAQTRRRLRTGHRAEPVVLQVPLPSSPRALPCLAMVSYLCSDERTPSSGSPSAPTH